MESGSPRASEFLRTEAPGGHMKSKSEADQTGVGEVAGSIEDPVPPGEVDQVDGADEVEEVEETLVDGNHALVAENLTGDGPSPTTSLSLTVEARG